MAGKEAAEELVTQYQDLLGKEKIILENLKPEDAFDRSLALEIALRGKSVEDYHEIVDGLFKAYEEEPDAQKREALNILTGRIMAIGSDKLGIDWS